MTDAERMEWLSALAMKSPTGISLEFVRGQGFRFMSRHRIDNFFPTLREAIDNGIRLRQDIMPPKKDKDNK